MNDDRLGSEARELIEQALREEDQVAPLELARIRKRVLSVSVGVGALGSAGKTLAGPATPTLTAVSVIKATLLGASAAVVALGISTVVQPKPPAVAPHTQPTAVTPAPTQSPRASVQATPIAGASFRVLRGSAEVALPNAAAATRSTPPTRPVPDSPRRPAGTSAPSTPQPVQQGESASASDSALLAEVAMLERVQRELRAGNGSGALALLDQNLPRSGQLGAERLAAEVFAACQAGDRGRARRAAQLFFQNYQGTPATARVRASCAGEESENAP